MVNYHSFQANLALKNRVVSTASFRIVRIDTLQAQRNNDSPNQLHKKIRQIRQSAVLNNQVQRNNDSPNQLHKKSAKSIKELY